MTTSALTHPSLILGLDLLLASLLIWCLAKLGVPRRAIVCFGGACVGWLALLGWMFGGQQLIPPDIGGPGFFALLLAGVAVVAALFFVTPIGDGFLRGGHEWLLIPQGMRAFFGAGFLMQGALGAMPPAFAIADGLTHIAAAVLALWTVWLVGKGYAGRGALWFANLFGLLDIVVVAAGLAFVLLPAMGPYHSVMYAAFFAAPLFIALHLLSIRRLLSAGRSGSPSSLQG
jgi:hypothetical protein